LADGFSAGVSLEAARKWRRMGRQCQYRWPKPGCMAGQFLRNFMVSAAFRAAALKALGAGGEVFAMPETRASAA
jgi:hypothetical protein